VPGVTTTLARSPSAPLRIAFNHTRLAESGGVEAYLFRLLRSLLERGHEVDYFCARVEVGIDDPRLRVVRVPQPRRPTSVRVALFASRSARAIAEAERLRPYDVVQGFGRTCHQTLYRDGSGCHADYREAYLDRVKRRGFLRTHYRLFPTDAVVQAIERRRYAKRPPRVVIAISRFVREQILRRYPLDPQRVRVLYNGLDLERHHPRLREAGRAELLREACPGTPAGEAPRVLAFVGSDFGRKGLDLLIDALALLEREPARRGHLVAVIGTDHREEKWRRAAARRGVAHRLRFLGFRRDVPALLAGSDGLVLPSWFDAFGNVVAEALACGTPVVASASCGGAEWIREGENGFVVPRQEAACLAQKLRALLDLEEPGALREMARRTALAYPWEAHVDALLSVYREIAEDRGGAA
jgi:UDP-glucose:(heptosyl)LPS alpha-1,3-glucosyltransferase